MATGRKKAVRFFPFLLLPRELRDEVYRHLISDKREISRYRRHDKRICASIIHLNREIRLEFLEIFYDVVTAQLSIFNNPSLSISSICIPPNVVPKLKSLRIIYEEDSPAVDHFREWDTVLSDAAKDLSLFPHVARAEFTFIAAYSNKSQGRLWKKEDYLDPCEIAKHDAVEKIIIRLNKDYSVRTQYEYTRVRGDDNKIPQYQEVIVTEEIEFECLGTFDSGSNSESD